MQNNSFDVDAIIKNLKRSSFSGKIKEQDLEKVEKVSGDASSRQYFRIRTKNKNYILCLDRSHEGPSNNNHFRKNNLRERRAIIIYTKQFIYIYIYIS